MSYLLISDLKTDKTDSSCTLYEAYRQLDTDQTTYTCKVCSDKSQSAYLFKKHVYQVHQLLTVLAFCDLCEYVLRNVFVLYQHQQKVHGIQRIKGRWFQRLVL
jgi:hypothetical protein